MNLLLDGNSILNAALLGGTDEEFGQTFTDAEGKKTKVNGYQFGVDKFFEKIDETCKEFDATPRQMSLVWDGRNSKMIRQNILEGYKARRDKDPRVSEQLNLARGIVTKAMLSLGARVISQNMCEADDVLGYLCKTMRAERNVVVTSDGDLNVLVDENTDVWRLGKLSENPYGPFPHKYITLYKALVGDTSDKIPGAKGFGDAAWCDLVRVFGLDGLDAMIDLIKAKNLESLSEDVGDLKSLQKIIDGRDLVIKSFGVARLHVERVNTISDVLEVKAGMVAQWGSEDYQAPSLRRFYGTKLLVTSENYAAVKERCELHKFAASPFVTLDIETSATSQSDEWMAAVKKATDSDRFDVLGHKLTGMSLTFGDNTQHTIYMSVDHKDTANISVNQCRELCELIPKDKHIIIQNRAFEFQVLYRAWGEKWKDNGWFGFVPNSLDTKVGASYVDENVKKGLKQRSLHHLGYTQASFEQTTQRSAPVNTLKGGDVVKTYKVDTVPAVWEQIEKEYVDDETGEITTAFVNGKLISKAVQEDWETRQYRMNQLTAAEVFDYGCDDTICTAALHTHYKWVMDLEGTWDTYLAVETLPEYLTSLAFVQGIPVDRSVLKEMKAKDQATYDEAWKTFRAFLMKKGWEGTTCPEFCDDIEPADAKMAVDILLDGEFTTKKRKLNAIASDIRTQFPDSDRAGLLAAIVERNDVEALNDLVKANYTGEPKINFGSPKQMQALFYTTMGIKPRIVNKMTDNQRENEDMVSAFKKFREAKTGKKVTYTPEEHKALISKASTDDTAVDTAIAMDNPEPEVKEVLLAYKAIKEVQTRQNLFYKTYEAIPHWRDGRIHPALNQSEAVTRRYSSSGPNIQQLPSKGEGAKFREILLPHKPEAVVVSLDFSGQELRLGAELSGDKGMTSCYIGDNLRDMHSLTAVAAAATMWGQPVTYEDFQKMRKSDDPVIAAKAKKLRDDAKTVNFAAQFGAMAAKIAETMMCDEAVAQTFLDARVEAFPGIVAWDKAVQAQAKKTGYSVTMLGARRHLREALSSENSWDRSKAERQVGNFAIQGSAAEMTKLAMVRVWTSGVCTGRFDAQFLATIHDEIVVSVHKDHAVEVIKELHRCMVADYAGMKIPLESSIAIGRNFACDIEIGTEPDESAIQGAVDKLFEDQHV